MSWLARSIANSLKFDDDDEDDVNTDRKPEHKEPEAQSPEYQSTDGSSPTSPSRGVKEDLSEFSKTLSSRFWGVASFLAPPPQPEQNSEPDVPESEEDPILGIRDDFAEIGGKFRSGISRLSNNINVSEITKMASNFLQLESENENEESGKRVSLDSIGKESAVGVTEEVAAFARDISMHPETWLDFPLPDIVEDNTDFDMSDAQQEHALAVERLAPGLASLRLELCPEYMNESSFWMIYFVLLQPRLNKQDAELLSTPQIVEARSLLACELKNHRTSELEDLSGKRSSGSEKNAPSHDEALSVPSPGISKSKPDNATDLNDMTTTKVTSEIRKHPAEVNEIQIEDKAAAAEKDPSQGKDKELKSGEASTLEDKDDDETDDWLEEETSEIGGAAGKAITIENDDDVSFSDLEEDDGDTSSSFRKSNSGSDKDSREWIRLGKSSSKSSKDTDAHDQDSKESNDWLDIDDIVVT